MSQGGLVLEAAPLYLHPGDVAVGADGEQFVTVLGSCVSMCLWVPGGTVGGMNHFVLPEALGTDMRSRGRVAESALEELLSLLRRAGASPPALRAKLFGGSCRHGDGPGIGERNVVAARTLLARAGIPVLGADTGGSAARKLLFSSDTGQARVRRLGA